MVVSIEQRDIESEWKFIHHAHSLSPPLIEDPCGQWRYGDGKLDADLHTWDVIQDFELDNYQRHAGTIRQITGSSSYQTAYRFERESNLTMRAHDAFPRGTPFQFSLECTYRNRQPQPSPWHIFHLTNSRYESQLSVTMNPLRKTLAISLPDSQGDLQTVEFRHSSVSLEINFCNDCVSALFYKKTLSR
jgi:collagen type IX alpha